MELFQVGTDPWGQEIIIRISWGLLTVAFWAGIAFVLFHAVYAVVWKPKGMSPSRPLRRQTCRSGSCVTLARLGCFTG